VLPEPGVLLGLIAGIALLAVFNINRWEKPAKTPY
jgi:hypothetical protein